MGSGNVGGVVAGADADGAMVGVVAGVFLRTLDESQTMCLLRPQTPPVGLVQPQKP